MESRETQHTSMMQTDQVIPPGYISVAILAAIDGSTLRASRPTVAIGLL